jgi:hypothetical protein
MFQAEAPVLRELRADEVADDAHLTGTGDTDALRQQHREPPPGHDADARVKVGEPGVLRRDQEVASQDDLESTPDSAPTDSSGVFPALTEAKIASVP